MVDDSPGAGTSLFLSPGDLVGVFVQNIPDVQLISHFSDARLYIGGRRHVDGEGQSDVLGNRQCNQQIEVLEDNAQVFPSTSSKGYGEELLENFPFQVNWYCVYSCLLPPLDRPADHSLWDYGP